MQQKIAPETSLAELALRSTAAGRVFHRYRLDFCCRGGRALADACQEAGLEPLQLADEILAEEAAQPSPTQNWDAQPASAVIEHILTVYHEPLRPELDRLYSLAERVLNAHGAKEPDKLPALLATLGELRQELIDHLAKEEQVLFPWILRGEGRFAGGPISVMLREHHQAAHALETLDKLTDGHQAPAWACPTYRALCLGLAQLDRDLKDHIHLENHVLFPKALER